MTISVRLRLRGLDSCFSTPGNGLLRWMRTLSCASDQAFTNVPRLWASFSPSGSFPDSVFLSSLNVRMALKAISWTIYAWVKALDSPLREMMPSPFMIQYTCLLNVYDFVNETNGALCPFGL